MILFLSSSFLRRVGMMWKPSLRAFLVGDRNLFFFYPDSIVEVLEINPATIDSFLEEHGNESMQLLGFLTPTQLPFVPGYLELNTGGKNEPGSWSAGLHLFGEQGEDRRNLEIRVSAEL